MEFKQSSLENMVMNRSFWKDKKVLITGHTGFKGSWLALWLQNLGADLIGYSLPSPTNPNLFKTAHVERKMNSILGDVRDLEQLKSVIQTHQPQIIFHLAAQSLVRFSYSNPIETYSTNVMGTVNLLEAVRLSKVSRVVVNVTSDKCYENQELTRGYQEEDRMGGYDPYSSSKGCSELLTSAFRNSFFHPKDFDKHGLRLASARAGNVIGGGDWAVDRLFPDMIRALVAKEQVIIRNPNATRPWQHVLEPLSGYLLLAQKLWDEGEKYSEGWNFGPKEEDTKTVSSIVEKIIPAWSSDAQWILDKNKKNPHEANFLKLDCSKAKNKLGWEPRWSIDIALEQTMNWYKAYYANKDMRQFTLEQIALYSE